MAGLAFIFVFPFFLLINLILAVLWFRKKDKAYAIVLAVIWGGIATLAILMLLVHIIYTPMKLEKEDYYGNYVIDRNFFRGRQADWQYNTYRFEITENDSIFFHVTDGEKILRTYKGVISTRDPNNVSARLSLKMEEPSYHVTASDPTTYREAWTFHLVFNSPYYSNMFFKKGNWEPLDR